MHVLAIGAHPDDLEILCAGTLARFAAEGHRVTMVHASVGDKGHGQISHADVATTRRAEARAAAEVIGAESRTLGFLDGEIRSTQENLRTVVDAIRATPPDVILTHHPDDYHADHRTVTQLVLDASFMATVPYFVTQHPAHGVTCPIYYLDTLSGLGFQPNEYVDIGGTLDVKQRAMACHESQVTWLAEHHDSDIADQIETMARFRGLQCGVTHAEGFRRLEAWGRMSPERHLP